MSHPWVDIDAFPLLVLRFPATATTESLEGYYDALDAFYAELDQPVGWLVDLTHARLPDASQRRIAAERERRVEGPARRFNRGSGIVAPTAITRGIVTAVFWLAPPPYPYAIFARRADARTWVAERLAAPTP